MSPPPPPRPPTAFKAIAQEDGRRRSTRRTDSPEAARRLQGRLSDLNLQGISVADAIHPPLPRRLGRVDQLQLADHKSRRASHGAGQSSTAGQGQRPPRPSDNRSHAATSGAGRDNGDDIRQFADGDRRDRRRSAAERVAVGDRRSAKSGKSSFEIRLDPAELGRIDVRIDVDRNGQVTSHLTVEKPETLSMLRQDAPQLQRALDDAGFKTGDSGLQFSLRDQSSSGQNSGNESGRNAQRLVISEDDTMPAAAAGRSYGRMLGSSSGVDIRV